MILADSRGRGIELALNNHPDIGIYKVIVNRGAGYERTVADSLALLKTFEPDMVLLFSGICDLTKRDRKTKVTSLITNNVENSVEAVIAALSRALVLLNDEGFTSVLVATLTGLDLRRYNKLTVSPKVAGQEVLDSAILAINRRIIDTNKANGVPTPWTASVVHSYYRGSYHFHYHKLRDGCHPTTATMSYWARMMAKAINLTKKS